jgi:hypothetical protein
LGSRDPEVAIQFHHRVFQPAKALDLHDDDIPDLNRA